MVHWLSVATCNGRNCNFPTLFHSSENNMPQIVTTASSRIILYTLIEQANFLLKQSYWKYHLHCNEIYMLEHNPEGSQ